MNNYFSPYVSKSIRDIGKPKQEGKYKMTIMNNYLKDGLQHF
jgi:hypothetical protein